jgi:hypothetical protein
VGKSERDRFQPVSTIYFERLHVRSRSMNPYIAESRLHHSLVCIVLLMANPLTQCFPPILLIDFLSNVLLTKFVPLQQGVSLALVDANELTSAPPKKRKRLLTDGIVPPLPGIRCALNTVI